VGEGDALEGHPFSEKINKEKRDRGINFFMNKRGEKGNIPYKEKGKIPRSGRNWGKRGGGGGQRKKKKSWSLCDFPIREKSDFSHNGAKMEKGGRKSI